MTKPMAVSVHQRLLNISRQEHRRFNDLMQHYALEPGSSVSRNLRTASDSF